MKFRDYAVTQILVGLHRVGVVGLQDAIKAAEASGLTDREQLVAAMMEELASSNYITEQQLDAYRSAVWREYLRHRGEDFSAFLSEVPVTIRGTPGEQRDRFVATVRSVLAGIELRPVVTFEVGEKPPAAPQLVIRGEVVANGSQTRRSAESAIRHSVSDW